MSSWQALVSLAVGDVNKLQQELHQHSKLEIADFQHDAHVRLEAAEKLGEEEDFHQLAALSDFALLSGDSKGW